MSKEVYPMQSGRCEEVFGDRLANFLQGIAKYSNSDHT
jgi:hypothetical protein